ncbi:MAG: hypothetical protein QRY71_01435 [Candidatus Rhabdochlamydia sp.]
MDFIKHLPATKEANTLQQEQMVYTQAVQEYEKGNYLNAHDLFLLFSSQNPLQKEGWQGLAACQQMQKAYSDSLTSWAMTALLDASDPYPHFHAAECFIAQNNFPEAQKALTKALSLPCTELLLEQIHSLTKVLNHA